MAKTAAVHAKHEKKEVASPTRLYNQLDKTPAETEGVKELLAKYPDLKDRANPERLEEAAQHCYSACLVQGDLKGATYISKEFKLSAAILAKSENVGAAYDALFMNLAQLDEKAAEAVKKFAKRMALPEKERQQLFCAGLGAGLMQGEGYDASSDRGDRFKACAKALRLDEQQIQAAVAYAMALPLAFGLKPGDVAGMPNNPFAVKELTAVTRTLTIAARIAAVYVVQDTIDPCGRLEALSDAVNILVGDLTYDCTTKAAVTKMIESWIGSDVSERHWERLEGIKDKLNLTDEDFSGAEVQEQLKYARIAQALKGKLADFDQTLRALQIPAPQGTEEAAKIAWLLGLNDLALLQRRIPENAAAAGLRRVSEHGLVTGDTIKEILAPLTFGQPNQAAVDLAAAALTITNNGGRLAPLKCMPLVATALALAGEEELFKLPIEVEPEVTAAEEEEIEEITVSAEGDVSEAVEPDDSGEVETYGVRRPFVVVDDDFSAVDDEVAVEEFVEGSALDYLAKLEEADRPTGKKRGSLERDRRMN